MKILLVGPGKMKIPNDGWGAVEILIWQLKIHLEAMGHQVDILNEKGREAAVKSKPWKYDFVHLHFDGYAPLWIELSEKYKFKLIATTHHGYAAFPKKWNKSYEKTFGSLLKVRNLLVLSPEIKEIFQSKGYKGNIEVLPNGTEVSQIKFSKLPGNGRAICLGKISSRKKQAELSREVKELRGLICDFVGPLADTRFTCNNKDTFYLGEWNRNQVHRRLTQYSCLLLPSQGEAHPLVVIEALAAGLSVVVSPEASANLNKNLPFIHVCKFSSDFVKQASKATKENYKYRSQIRKYAEQNFDWRNISKRYIRILERLKK